MQWHYARQGQQFGPVDDALLRRLAQQNQLSPDDLVWNPTMGDQWAPASTVENLFAEPPQLTPPPLAAAPGAGTTSNRELMRLARESLRTHWGLGIGIVVLYQVIISGTSSFPLIGPIASLLVGGPLAVGFNLVFLSLARRTKADVGQLFRGFSNFGTTTAAYLLSLLFILLWTLLLIIPGLIAALSYAMTFYLLADEPALGAREAIARSKAMMRGHKWKLFCLGWRFFGWALLCLLTLGIGFLWLVPYMQAANAHFYEDIRRKS